MINDVEQTIHTFQNKYIAKSEWTKNLVSRKVLIKIFRINVEIA